MAPPIRINRRRTKKPDLAVSKALTEIALMHEYEELDDVQKVAHLSIWYESEVNNGGHLQYFHNRRLQWIEETIAALATIGASGQAEILRRAVDRWQGTERRRPRTLMEYHGVQVGREFGDLDAAFYKCSPDISGLLDDYANANESHFVEWT
jgi:hypothetical protein